MNKDSEKVRAIAFYLPQFHPIPENDKWWGEGFTEWTNVRKSKSLFKGHYQPHEPSDEIGYYDLLETKGIHEKQADLARDHGIYGFCYYYYWFHGKRLLEKPLVRMLESGKPNFPFCVCWANETWSRRWDGQDHEILMEQTFSLQDDIEFIKGLIPFFKDPRYIKIGNRPLLAVWRAEKLPDPKKTIEIWKTELEKEGIPAPYLVQIASHVGDTDPSEHGFDAAVEFAPDWRNIGNPIPIEDMGEKVEELGSSESLSHLKIYDYETTLNNMLGKVSPPYKLFRGVFPSWDNTPRRGENGTVFINSSPEGFRYFLRGQLRNTLVNFKGDERLLFINAWNEWAEGCHLEPDKMYGKRYLEICKELLEMKEEDILKLTFEERKIKDLKIMVEKQAREREILREDIEKNTKILSQLEEENRFMRSSKFWKLRNMWEGVKWGVKNPERAIIKHKNRIYFVFFHPLKFAKKYVQILIGKKKQRDFNKEIVLLKKDSPKISIIVPNYNHEEFLRQRLDSIYSQTYTNYEVILLDDNSSDRSRDILQEYFKKYPERTKIFLNKENSGSVFSQWKKGVSESMGEIIWIAESDDYCDRNFLETLVPYFRDESIMLAYAHPVFVNSKGKRNTFTFEKYVASLSKDKWKSSYIETAHNEVNLGFGIKNTIPNVSGVIFRKMSQDVFNYDSLRDFKVCGDWFFYLSIIRGGRLAYSLETNNYYRFHVNNTSSNYQTSPGFIKEHEMIAKHVAKNYKVNDAILSKNKESVLSVWKSRGGDFSVFEKNFDLKRILESQSERKPNVLMAIFAFSTGGGEVVPIQLSNELKKHQYGISVFDYCYYGIDVSTIRNKLLSGIPIVRGLRDSKGIDWVIENFGIEIIHTHHLSLDLLFSNRKNKNVAHVVTMHGMYEMLEESVFRDAIAFLKDSINYWVYVADKNIRPFEFVNWPFLGRSKKILNGVIIPKQNKISRENFGLSDADFVICLVSRALKEKGWAEAINAVEIAGAMVCRNIVLLLIGDGPVYDELKDKALPSNIRMLGYQDNVYDYFSVTDAGILPTYYKGESCPMVLLEGLACGCPFISTDVGEIRKMLTLENGEMAGEIVNLDKEGRINPNDLAKCIVRWVNDAELCSRFKNNAVLLQKNISIERMVSEYKEVYKDCMKNK